MIFKFENESSKKVAHIGIFYQEGCGDICCMETKLTNKRKAEIYLKLAKKYDDAIRSRNRFYSVGVCIDLDDYVTHQKDTQDSFKEWWLFATKERIHNAWWEGYSEERVLALLFAHQIALNP